MRSIGIMMITCGLLLGLLLGMAQAEEKNWKVFENCTLMENESNDGDSFHVSYNKRHYIFRLYWTDTPETDTRYPERNQEQATYFGISDKDALRIGKEATRFSEAQLKQPFTVYTTYQNARGASDQKRYYAMIKVGDRFLSEELVAAGLSRIKGYQPDPPGATSERTFRTRLSTLEKDAKKKGLGAWGENTVKAQPAPAAATRVPGTLAEGARPLVRQALVFSAKAPHSPIGTLRKGHEVEILEAAHGSLVKIRFALPSGKMVEGLCERTYIQE